MKTTMLQVVPHSEKYYVYGPNMERLYVYRFSGYEQSEILISRKLVSKAELKKTMEKINKNVNEYFAKKNIILGRLNVKKISRAKANKELEELEKKKPQHWKDILYDKFGLRQLVVDRQSWIGSML